MNSMWNGLKRFVKEEDAPTMVEYGLLVALIAVVCIGAVTLLGTSISAQLGTAAGAVQGAGSGSGS